MLENKHPSSSGWNLSSARSYGVLSFGPDLPLYWHPDEVMKPGGAPRAGSEPPGPRAPPTKYRLGVTLLLFTHDFPAQECSSSCWWCGTAVKDRRVGPP